MPDETHGAPRGLDAADLRILDELVRNGRASHRELARRTAMSLATVNRRVRELERSGALRGTHARVAPEAVGWGLTVLVGMRIEKGHLRHVQQEVAKDPRVFAVYDVTGEWDGFVLARCRDRADLDELAKSTLSRPHIQRTNTMVVLSTVKEEAIVQVPAPGRQERLP